MAQVTFTRRETRSIRMPVGGYSSILRGLNIWSEVGWKLRIQRIIEFTTDSEFQLYLLSTLYDYSIEIVEDRSSELRGHDWPELPM